MSWIPLGIAITGICGLIHVTVQQYYRQSLNDPQIQMAEDGAAALGRGATPTSVVPGGQQIDIAESLLPWIAVYDAGGKPLASSGVLDGTLAQPPIGVFDAAKHGLPLIVEHHISSGIASNENRISWQPRRDVRQAIIIVWVPETKKFVASGRNMREVEDRELKLGTTVGLGWIVLMLATLFATILTRLPYP